MYMISPVLSNIHKYAVLQAVKNYLPTAMVKTCFFCIVKVRLTLPREGLQPTDEGWLDQVERTCTINGL